MSDFKETGSAHARKLTKQSEPVGPEKSMTPLEWQEFKRLEALNERSKLDRLRRENNDRIAAERRADLQRRKNG